MVLNGFDSAKTLKVIAMGNFSSRRKLKWLFELCVFLFLVSRRSSWFSFAGPVLLQFFRRLVAVLNSHIFVFMFFNAMLFVVYSLSGLSETKPSSNRTDAAAGESPESLVPPSDDSVAEILVVGEKNAVTTAPADEVAIVATPAVEDPAEPTEPTPSRISPVPHSTSAAETAEEIILGMDRYRRTESERFEERREGNKFRQSKTEIRRETGEEPARFLRSVQEMDIDDFNRKVESFIAEQKLHIGGWISD